MEKRTKGCLLAALAVAVVGVMVLIALVAGAGYWAYQNLAPETKAVDERQAAAQLAEIRARFKEQQPLIDVHEGGHGDARLHTEGRPPFTGQLQSLHIAAYDKHSGRIMRVSVPFWLLRLAPHGNVHLGSDVLKDVSVTKRLTVRQLEALGPGLVIDETEPDGDRVLVWTE